MTSDMTRRVVVFVCAGLLAASLGYGIVRIPIQLHDSLDEIVLVHEAPGVWAAFTSTIGKAAYFRPLRFAEDKVLMDLAPGHYSAAFKSFHVALVAAAFVLFVSALPVQSAADAAAAIFALSVFAGLHTFVGLVREAYPINHFLQVLVLALVALHLARSRGGRAIDAAAIVTFVLACLTLESGILIWVVLVTSRFVGRRGVSDAGLAIVTALLVAYLATWFVWVAPNVERMGNASGYFFERLERPDVLARFGSGLTRFNLYNVIVSMSTVLLSEPRAGVFVFVRALSGGDVPARMWINVISSIITTAFLAAAAWRRWSGARPRDGGSVALVLFGSVLCASAIASNTYAKDEIVSVAGAFYALAVFWAVRDLLSRRHGLVATAALAIALMIAGAGWAVRTVGVQHVLRMQAFNVRNDWAWTPEDRQRLGTWPSDVRSRELILDLRRQALRTPVVNPWFMPRWADRVFDVDSY